MSQPTAVLREVLKGADNSNSDRSAIPVFSDAVESITTNDARALRFAPVIRHISEMTAGAKSKFGFAEVRTGGDIVRIDDFLRKRASAARKATQGRWYEGVSYGSFDGKLNYVDNRGALPQIKLTLTAGGKEVDCVCPRDLIEDLGHAIDHRVRVSGRAIYSSGSPLPIRVEVKKINHIKPVADLTRWRGSMAPFTMSEWDAHVGA